MTTFSTIRPSLIIEPLSQAGVKISGKWFDPKLQKESKLFSQPSLKPGISAYLTDGSGYKNCEHVPFLHYHSPGPGRDSTKI
jgi:hypothetical protein